MRIGLQYDLLIDILKLPDSDIFRVDHLSNVILQVNGLRELLKCRSPYFLSCFAVDLDEAEGVDGVVYHILLFG
jgi:hypothetical protein